MRCRILFLPVVALIFVASCSRPDSTDVTAPAGEAANAAREAAETAGEVAQTAASNTGPRASVHLKDGSKVPGTIVASSTTHMVVAGDDGIERKIPLAQVKSVEYGDVQSQRAARQSGTPPPVPPRAPTPPRPDNQVAERAPETKGGSVNLSPTPPAVTTKTFELPAGSEVSVRTNEAIDSKTAAEGQTFDAQVTRDAKDANGGVVIPRGSKALIVIRSASGGGSIRGASDLVLDLQSVVIRGKQYAIDTVDVTKRGKSGIGANRRTAEYTGGGAAVGAIIGAIAGGGKGAAIGAGAGAGAGALTQILTKGKAIQVPVESVLTFSLDKPLKVTQVE